MGKIRSDFDN